jgi:hypothetical protein
MSRARVIPSAAVVVYVNGKQFGRVQAFNFRSLTPRKALYGIDSTDPYELAPTIGKITASMSVFRTVGDGGAEGGGMAATMEDLSKEKYFSVMLVDRGAQDSIIFQADYCSLSSQAWSIVSRGIITGSLEFEALTWSNDVKPLGINFSG